MLHQKFKIDKIIAVSFLIQCESFENVFKVDGDSIKI